MPFTVESAKWAQLDRSATVYDIVPRLSPPALMENDDRDTYVLKKKKKKCSPNETKPNLPNKPSQTTPNQNPTKQINLVNPRPCRAENITSSIKILTTPQSKPNHCCCAHAGPPFLCK